MKERKESETDLIAVGAHGSLVVEGKIGQRARGPLEIIVKETVARDFQPLDFSRIDSILNPYSDPKLFLNSFSNSRRY
jgi:hypothetical protein